MIARKNYIKRRSDIIPYVKYHPWASKLINGIRKRAKLDKRFIKDDCVNPQYLRNLYNKQKGLCYYTGLPMHIDIPMYKPSPDRIDSSVGYVDGNIVLCCTAINFMKNSSSKEEVLNFIEAIRCSKIL